MKRNKLSILALVVLCIAIVGCNLASGARDTIATSYGYLTWAQGNYGITCKASPMAPTCSLITRAIGIHNAAVDSLNAYCNGTPLVGQAAWTAGGPCAPVKNLQGALQAALTALNPIIADLRLLATGKSAPVLTTNEVLAKPSTQAALLSVRIESGL
jgi:hypothetical protein